MSNDKNKLNPCPFCGKKPKLVSGFSKCYAECVNGSCHAVLYTKHSKKTKAEAIKLWNKRA